MFYLNKMFDLDLLKAVKEIKKIRVKTVLIQLPDGLKQKATEIVNTLEKNTNAKVFIWFNSCYGSCDIPAGIEKLKFDLLIHFGHSKWQN